MKLLLLDREENLVSIISEATTPPVYEEELNGLDVFELEVADTEIEKGYRLLFKDVYSDWREYMVVGVEEKHNRSGLKKKVYCESSFYELLGDWLEDIRPTNTTARAALTQAISTTRWEVGAVDDLGLNSTNFYRTDAKTAVEKIADVWDGEIKTRIEVIGNKITGRFIDLYKNRGTDKGKRFTYTKDIEEVERSVSEDLVITALHGFGKGEEIGEGFGRRLDFSDINGGKTYLENVEALSVFGRNNSDGIKSHIFGKVEFDDIEDKEVLKAETKKALDILSAPSVTYKAKVQDLSIFGYVHERVNLGDYVWVIDKEFIPELRFQARIVKIKRNLVNELETEITLGNVQETYTAKSNSKDNYLNSIRDKIGVLDKVVDGSYQLPKAEGEGSLFFGQAEPSNPHNGDIWFKKNGEFSEMWQYVDGQWILIISTADLDQVKKEVDAAQQTAEANKQKAEADLEAAKVEANQYADQKAAEVDQRVTSEIETVGKNMATDKQEALVQIEAAKAEVAADIAEQDRLNREKFNAYDAAVDELTESVGQAGIKADDALREAGTSMNLSQTAKDAAERAERNSTAATGNALEAVDKANDAVRQTNQIPATIDAVISNKGLVSGSWVDRRIDGVTGEINYELANVKGDTPTVIMGIEWDGNSSPMLARTGYVEETVNLDDYRVQTAAFNVTVDGIKNNITDIQNKKLDAGVFTSFKNNEYSQDVTGIRNRLASVETQKLDSGTFQDFREHDYSATVDGFAGKIKKLETDKLDSRDFNSFKSNEYQLTVDGFTMELSDVRGTAPDYILGVEWDLSENPELTRTDDLAESDTSNPDNPNFVMGISWNGESEPTLIRTDYVEDTTSKQEFETFLGDYHFAAEGWNATNTYVTNNKTQINSLISNASGWQQTITYVDNHQTKFNETIAQVDSYKQTIGTNGEKITQLVMTDSAFITTVGELEGQIADFIVGVEWDGNAEPTMARTGYMDDYLSTQVSQLAGSWALNLKSGSDIKASINATTDGIRLAGKTIHLSGDSLIDNAVIKSAHIDNLNVSKLTGTEAEFAALRAKVIVVGSITSDSIASSTGLIDKIFSSQAMIDRLWSKAIWTNKLTTITLDASKITSGTISAARLDIEAIKALVLTADVVEAIHIKADVALFDKVFVNDAVIDKLTAKQAFISSVKAIDISADRITTGTLNAANVNIINLNANRIATGTITGANSLWNLNTGLLLFQKPLSGDILNLTQGEIYFQKGSNSRYLNYHDEGLILSPGAGNYGTGLNTSVHLNGGVSYIQFNNRAGTSRHGRVQMTSDSALIQIPDSATLRIINGSNIAAPISTLSLRTEEEGGWTVEIKGDSIKTPRSGNRNIWITPNGTGSVVAGESNGGRYNVVASDFVKQSSRTTKTNIIPLREGLSVINSLTPVQYNKIDKLKQGIVELEKGFISEDSLAVATPDGKGIYDSHITAHLVKAVQELHGEVRRNTTFATQRDLEIQKLKKRISELEEKIS